jgi:radical SAM superfamily enzyme YgiQ (UPF0313 family)
MNNSDVLLILPPGGYYAERWKAGSLMPPLGLFYLAAVLEQNNFRVAIIDAHLEQLTVKGVVARTVEINPKVIGVSFSTDNRFPAFATIEALKSSLPRTPLVLGGPHPSLTAEDTLTHIAGVDYIVRGEGELVFVRLLHAILENPGSISEIPGVSFRQNGVVVHNPRQELITDLDTLPFPARHLHPFDKYNLMMDVPGKGPVRGATMLAARGCPFSCNFCSSSEMWGRRVRARTPANVVAEILEVRDRYRAEALWFLDDVFAIRSQHALDLCQAFTDAGIKMPFICEIRVDIVDFELLKILKDTGCYCVGFGVESGSQRMIDQILNKKIKIEQVKRVRDWCAELDIISNPFFIYSHPEETQEDLDQTLDLIRTWPKKSWIGLKLLHVYPGTEVERIAYRRGILPPDFSWSKPVDKRVEIMPSTQGDVPIFRDKLTWEQLGGAMAEWVRMRDYPVWKKIPGMLKDIRTPRDILRYLALAYSYFTGSFKKHRQTG